MGNVFGSAVDFLTFDVFDLDQSRKRPDVNLSVPGPTADEQELIKLQTEALRRQLAPPTPEEEALQQRMQDYYSQMLADQTLSGDEEAAFDQEYQLQMEALQEQYGLETTRLGASRMAELASRGVLGTTTGEDILAQDQQKYAGVLSENIAGLGQAKELAKSDMELAKRQMAMQGYQLTSGLLQSRQADALSSAATMQNYFTGQRNMTANAALQSALMNQTWEQHAYNQRMSGFSTTAGIGIGMMKSGFGGGGGMG